MVTELDIQRAQLILKALDLRYRVDFSQTDIRYTENGGCNNHTTPIHSEVQAFDIEALELRNIFMDIVRKPKQ